MALWTLLQSQMVRSGHKRIEVVRLTTAAATSASTSLDYVTRLNYIDWMEVGHQTTPSCVSATAMTWTNATAWPGHATVSVSGISVTVPQTKILDLVLFGGA